MGGVALVVVIVGLVIVLWPRGDGQIEFQAAEQAYQERQYATAIEKYDVLLRAFPRHEQASLARVHRGLAVIHTAHGSAGENSQLLAKLQQEAPALAGEPAIGQAHNELVPLLLKLTEDLTTTAASSKAGQASKEQLQAARAALALCNDARLLPANLRPWQKLAEYEERLQLRERELDRQAAIAAAQKAMNEQLQTGDVSAALAARRQALQQFADAASAIDSPELTASLLAAARSSVKPEPLSQSPATEPPTSAVVASYPWHSLASPSAADSAPSAVIPVLAAETVYGLDAVSGRVVWSRYLGGASALSSLVASDGQTACLLDVSKQELLRVGLLDGAVRWRQRLPAKPVGLVQVNQGIVVALDSGMLLRFAIADGEGSAQVQLPQSLSRPPLRLNDKRLVQWADEALVYVLDAETLACEQVIAVGHELGMLMHGVAVPRAKDVQLLAALRLPNQKTRLVLTGMLAEAAESHSLTLDGQPADSPLLLGNRVLLPWLSGEVLAFSLDDEKPLQNKAAVAIPPTVKQVHAWQTQAGAVYALGVGLSRLNHDGPSAMTTEWSALADHSVASLFGLSEKLVIATYFDASRQAWLAAALEPASGQVQWTTSLSPSMQLVAAEGANPHVLPLPFAAGTSLLLKLDSNRYVLGAIGHDQLVVQGSGPAATGNEALTIQLPAPLAGQPALVGKLLLVPLVTGEVLGIDANTYQTQTLAIRVASPASDRPLAIAAYPGPQAESEVLLCTSESVVLWKQGLAPQSTWTEETTVRWSEPLVSAPVVTNAAVVGFAPSGKVLTLTLPDLTPGVATDLAGAQVAAGPWIVGDSILLTTTAGELVSLSPAGERQWQQSLATGSLAGSPSAAGEKLVIAGKAGVIELRAAATGELVQSLDAGQPLLGSPLALGKQLWVPAMSGQILQLGSPTEGAQP
jgi:outer membrane protein assembly factor BamB